MELINFVINFWLIVTGGSFWSEIAVALTFLGVGLILITLSLYIIITYREKFILPNTVAALFFIFSFTGTLYLSLVARNEMHAYFNDCVQLETKTERFEQTVMIRMCRERNNVKDLWGIWHVAGIQRGRHQNIPVVTELP